MKKLFVLLGVMVFMSVMFSECDGAEIPNLEPSVLFSCKNATLTAGVTSRMISYKDIDLRVGYMFGNKYVLGLSYDLDNLEKIADVEYSWDTDFDLVTTVLIWCGFDFDTGEYDYGISAILFSVNF